MLLGVDWNEVYVVIWGLGCLGCWQGVFEGEMKSKKLDMRSRKAKLDLDRQVEE